MALLDSMSIDDSQFGFVSGRGTRSSRSCYQFSLPATSLSPVLSSCHLSETWPLTKPNLQHLQLNDRAMIRQICNVKSQDIVTIRSNELLGQLGIEDLDLILEKASRVRVQSSQPVTYGLMERVGLGGPR